MIVNLTSCVASYPIIDPSYYSEPVYASPNATAPVYYQGYNYCCGGVYIVGDHRYPIGLYMKDLRIIRNGLIVTITDGTGEKIYQQYDLRVEKLYIDRIFTPTGLNGTALELRLCLQGRRGSNYVRITDGSETETFYLRR